MRSTGSGSSRRNENDRPFLQFGHSPTATGADNRVPSLALAQTLKNNIHPSHGLLMSVRQLPSHQSQQFPIAKQQQQQQQYQPSIALAQSLNRKINAQENYGLLMSVRQLPPQHMRASSGGGSTGSSSRGAAFMGQAQQQQQQQALALQQRQMSQGGQHWGADEHRDQEISLASPHYQHHAQHSSSGGISVPAPLASPPSMISPSSRYANQSTPYTPFTSDALHGENKHMSVQTSFQGVPSSSPSSHTPHTPHTHHHHHYAHPPVTQEQLQHQHPRVFSAKEQKQALQVSWQELCQHSTGERVHAYIDKHAPRVISRADARAMVSGKALVV